jgi:hypothetical protein
MTDKRQSFEISPSSFVLLPGWTEARANPIPHVAMSKFDSRYPASGHADRITLESEINC